jgi:hypothetical protein
MKQLLREFLTKIREASGAERYAAIITDPNYTRGEVGSVSYFHSIEARNDAIKRGTHKLIPGDTGKPSVPAFSTDDIVAPEDSPTQTSVPAFVGAEKYMGEVPLSVQIDPSTELHQTLPEQPADKVIAPVPQTISAPEIADVSQEIDEELSALSDGTLRPLAEGYADRDVSDQLSDDLYYKENPSVLPTRFVVPPEIRTALRAVNIPERYIKLLERTLNSSKSVNSSAMVGVVAAGTNASRFGEVLTMVLLALPKERRAEFVEMVSEATAQGKGKTAAESSWVESSVGHVSAFEATMDTRFGKGNWKVDGAAWGIKEDIAGLGMDPRDAGKATDVLVRVQVEGRGDAVGIRCSLKKDEGTNFLSLSLINLRSTLLQYHPDEQRAARASEISEKLNMAVTTPSTAGERELQEKTKNELRELAQLPTETKLPSWDIAKDRLTRLVHQIENEALEHAPPKLVEAFRLLDELGETQYKKNIEVLSGLLEELSDEAAAVFGENGTADRFGKAAFDCMKQSGGDPEKLAKCLGTKKIVPRDLTVAVHSAIQAIGEHYTKNKNKERAAIVEAKLEEIYDIGRNICNMYIESLMDTSTPGTLRGLVETMSQTFSIRSSLLGKQEVLVDGFYIDQESMRDVFGVETPEELEESLAIVDVDGNKVLVYRAKGSGEFIRIGNIQMRQKDRGTKTTIMLNMGASRQFMLCAGESGASVMARRGDGPDVGYTYHRETGKPAKKNHVWMEIGDTLVEVRDPLTTKHPETGVAAAEGQIWVSRPRVEGGKVVGYDTEEIDRTPQLAAVMRMRGKLKLDESMDFYTRKPRKLLLEFLRNILVETETTEFPAIKKASGDDSTDRLVYFGSEAARKKAIEIDKTHELPTDKEIEAGKARATSQEKTSTEAPTDAAQQAGATEQEPRPMTSDQREEAKRLAASLRPRGARLGPVKKKIIEDLADALESGDLAKVEAVISKHKIHISSTGKISFTADGTTTRGYLFWNSAKKEASMEAVKSITDALGKSGVALHRVVPTPKQKLKPSQLLPVQPDVVPEISEDGNLITFMDTSTDPPTERARLTREDTSDSAISAHAEQVAENTPKIKKILERLPPEGRKRYMVALRQYILEKREEHNRLLDTLIKNERASMQKDGISSVRPMVGRESIIEIADAIENLLSTQDIVDDPEAQRVVSLIRELSAATTRDEANKIIAQIYASVSSSALISGRAYIAELITASRIILGGGVAFFPRSEQFPLADVVSLTNNSVIGIRELTAIFVSAEIPKVDVDELEEYDNSLSSDVATGLVGVKYEDGGANSNEAKINNTEFKDGPPSSETGSPRTVADDLNALGRLQTSAAIWGIPSPRNPATENVELDNAEATIMEIAKDYEGDIRKYFGLADSPGPPTLDEIIDMLSTGKSLVCVNGVPRKSDSDNTELIRAEKGGDSTTARRWRLSFLSGMVTEAMHNRNAVRQGYQTEMHSPTGGVVRADGRRVLSAMSIQHVKGIGLRREVRVPDQGQVAHIVPMSAEQMRTYGNPCKTEQLTAEDILVNEIIFGHLNKTCCG